MFSLIPGHSEGFVFLGMCSRHVTAALSDIDRCYFHTSILQLSCNIEQSKEIMAEVLCLVAQHLYHTACEYRSDQCSVMLALHCTLSCSS